MDARRWTEDGVRCSEDGGRWTKDGGWRTVERGWRMEDDDSCLLQLSAAGIVGLVHNQRHPSLLAIIADYL